MAFSLELNSLSHHPLTINFRGHSSSLLTFLGAELPPFSYVCVQTCTKHRHFALFAFLKADAIVIDTTYKNIWFFDFRQFYVEFYCLPFTPLLSQQCTERHVKFEPLQVNEEENVFISLKNE